MKGSPMQRNYPGVFKKKTGDEDEEKRVSEMESEVPSGEDDDYKFKGTDLLDPAYTGGLVPGAPEGTRIGTNKDGDLVSIKPGTTMFSDDDKYDTQLTGEDLQ